MQQKHILLMSYQSLIYNSLDNNQKLLSAAPKDSNIYTPYKRKCEGAESRAPTGRPELGTLSTTSNSILSKRTDY